MTDSLFGMNVLFFLALAFLAMGILIFILGRKTEKKRAEVMAHRTEKTEGRLGRVDERPLNDTGFFKYVPIYTYTIGFDLYTVEGVPSPNRDAFSEAPVTVCYDPINPNDACIENDFPKKSGAITNLVGILFILAGIGMLLLNFLPF